MRFEFSAGGIVYKPVRQGLRLSSAERPQGKKDYLILVAQHSQHHGWVFPKGLIGDHKKKETKEETAIREVKEETGINARIIKPLEPITYWFVFKGEKIKKTVYYFLMEFVSGDTKNRDFEMEKVEWIPFEKVSKRLTYSSDKKVWQQAKSLIK